MLYDINFKIYSLSLYISLFLRIHSNSQETPLHVSAVFLKHQVYFTQMTN